MKKKIWILYGLLALIGAGMWIGRERAQESRALTTQYIENTEGRERF
jgi:hypothetical protein